MKRLLLLLLFLLLPITAYSQSGQAPPNRFRRLASAPNCTITGMVYFNTGTGKVQICTATGTPGTWSDLPSSGGTFDFGNDNAGNSFTFAPYFFGNGSATTAGTLSQSITDDNTNYHVGLYNSLTVDANDPTFGGWYNFGTYSIATIPTGFGSTLDSTETYGGYFAGLYSGTGVYNGRIFGMRAEGRNNNTNPASSTWGTYGIEADAIIEGVIPRFSSAAVSAAINITNTTALNPSGNGSSAFYGWTGGVTWNAPIGVTANEIAGINIKNQGGGASLNGAGNITTMYGLKINQPSTNFGTRVGTNYGLWLANHATVGTVNYNLYSAGSASKNYFEGTVDVLNLKLHGSTSGAVTLNSVASITPYTLTFPGVTGNGLLRVLSGNINFDSASYLAGILVNPGRVPRASSDPAILEDSPIFAADADIRLDSMGGTTQIGDINTGGNGVDITVDDAAQTITLDSGAAGTQSRGVLLSREVVDGVLFLNEKYINSVFLDDGFILIGRTAGPPAAGQITGGNGTVVTNGSGTISIGIDLNYLSFIFPTSISGAGSVLVSNSTNSSGKFTVTTTGVSTVTLTFSQTWTRAPSCFAQNETTANLIRVTPTTTQAVFVGTTVNGDKLSYICIGF